MLSSALPLLKTEIFNALKDKEIEDVFTNAFKSTIPYPSDLGDDISNQQLQKDIDDVAQQFGKLCAAGLAGTLSSKLADAIDKYVKQITITFTPDAISTIISPVGPCTGTISPSGIHIL